MRNFSPLYAKSATTFLAAGLLSISAGLSARAEFSVINLINTSSPLISEGLVMAPVLNDKGIFSFGANTSLYPNWQGIDSFGLLYGSIETPGSVSALNNVTFAEFGNATIGTFSLAIDNSNSVLWMNDNMGTRTLATINISQPGQPQQFTDTGTSMSGRSLGMNNNGLLGYRTGSNTEIRIYNTSSSTERTIATGNSASFYLSGGVSINDSGNIVYAVGDGSGQIFAYDWATETTLELTPSNVTLPLSDIGVSNPVINNSGLIAFFALDATTEEVGLYTMSLQDPAGLATLIATNSAVHDRLISLNDQGQLLFVDSDNALHFWNGITLETILKAGDSFAGGTISQLSISNYALNNEGYGVFHYQLKDGTIGIGLLTIPEPSTVLLMGCVAAVAIGLRSVKTRPSRSIAQSLK